jgi:adenosylmethionine-8-amino-7-oxononanoate aminotransferase
MALQYWHNKGISRKRIIALEGGYHGDTFGAMSVGERGVFTTPFWPFLFDVEFITVPEDDDTQGIDEFHSLVKGGDVAAFIFEPIIQGAAGMRMYSATWLDQLILIAKSNNVLCIADEVMTGFGRTGKLFASEYLKQDPDIFCLSKGLTGGTMALGATTCTGAVQNAFKHHDICKTFFHGHSFTGNPLACAAANASFELLMSRQCQHNINRITTSFGNFAKQLKTHNKIKSVTHLGAILAIEFRSGEQTSYVNEARHRLYPYFLSKGILLRPLGNIVYIIPPYVITDEELQQIYHALLDYLQEE